ncbi:MAG: hypothetical protein B6229_03815 [Spirochaetaceae bacterium 4572_7]|nr:MAG: hypothetical protein B6229_03815 [Spirochaetaceae bacterium 4572_7]
MEDIIDIYPPIYRNPNNIIAILITIFITILVIVGIYFIIKYIRKKKGYKTPKQKYEICLTDFLELQNKEEEISSKEFTVKLNSIFKEYLATIYSSKLLSTTPEELYAKLEEKGLSNDRLKNFIINDLQVAKYGHGLLSRENKDQGIKECVEAVTFIYNKEQKSD